MHAVGRHMYALLSFRSAVMFILATQNKTETVHPQLKNP